MNLIDTRVCVAGLTSPTVDPTYTYYIAKTTLQVDLSDYGNGNCKYNLMAYVSGGPGELEETPTTAESIRDSNDEYWISIPYLLWTNPYMGTWVLGNTNMDFTVSTLDISLEGIYQVKIEIIDLSPPDVAEKPEPIPDVIFNVTVIDNPCCVFCNNLTAPENNSLDTMVPISNSTTTYIPLSGFSNGQC